MPAYLMIVRQPDGWAWRPFPPVYAPATWWIVAR